MINDTLACWGDDRFGQLGDGGGTSQSLPETIAGWGSSVVAMGIGGYHTCVLSAAGGVQCSGLNDHGQLGTR